MEGVFSKQEFRIDAELLREFNRKTRIPISQFAALMAKCYAKGVISEVDLKEMKKKLESKKYERLSDES